MQSFWNCRVGLMATSLVLSLSAIANALDQSWVNTGSTGNQDFLNAANWQGPPAPSDLPGSPTNVANDDVAAIKLTTASTSVNAQINFDSTGTNPVNGNYTMGMIYAWAAKTGTVQVSSSAVTSPGVLTLNGVSGGSYADGNNNIIETINTTTGQTTTIGGGAQPMSINLATTGPNDGSLNRVNVFLFANNLNMSTSSVNLNDPIIGAGPLTFVKGYASSSYTIPSTGNAIVNLNGTNTYTGGSMLLLDDSVTGLAPNSNNNKMTVNVSGDNSAANGGWAVVTSINATGTVNFLPGSIVNVASGKQIYVNYTNTAAHSANINSGGTVNNAGTLLMDTSAGVTVQNGSVWTQSGPVTLQNSIDGSGYNPELTISAGGTFKYTGAGAIQINSQLNNLTSNNQINIAGGLFQTSQGFTNTSTAPIGTVTASSNVNILNGGTLQLTASVPSLATTAGGPLNIRLSGGDDGIIDTNGFNGTLASGSGVVISGSGNLVKSGAGTLQIATNSTYTGSTHVLAGSLVVNGSHTGGGLYTVDSGATLGGSGTIDAAVNLGGAIAPGNSAGTMTVGALTLLSGSSANMEMQNTAGSHAPGGGLSDLVNITGLLQIAAGSPTITINASAVGGGALGTGAGGTWTLATYATSSVLSTPTWVINGIASGYSAAIDLSTPNQVNLVLTAVPEPSTFVLAGLGLVGFVYLRRRSSSRLR